MLRVRMVVLILALPLRTNRARAAIPGAFFLGPDHGEPLPDAMRAAIQASISDSRQALVFGPSLIGAGNWPSLIQCQIVERATETRWRTSGKRRKRSPCVVLVRIPFSFHGL
jgi:hypothetical protein